ncbi:MAG: hypothetical protein R3D67_18995 [Hyphomicrobiaceae bacterium]
MDQIEQLDSQDERTPRLVRRLGFAVVALLMAGALYLIAVRGEAILVDLAALGGRIWCF